MKPLVYLKWVGFLVVICLSVMSALAVVNDAKLAWSFDNIDVIGSILQDISGYEHNATINGATGVTGICNESFYFDGLNDYLNTTTIADNWRTISVWIKPNVPITTTTGRTVLFGNFSTGTEKLEFSHWTSGLTNEMISLSHGGVTNAFYWTSATVPTISNTTWTHLVFVWNATGTNYNLYINGTFISAATKYNAPTIYSTPSDLGRGNSQYFAGLVDMLLIYNNTKNSTEIQELYNSGNCYNPYITLPTFIGLNVSFYDEETLIPITNRTVSMTIYSDNYSNVLTTTTGNIYTNILSPNNYTIRYAASGYITRQYSFILYNNTLNSLNLSMLNASSGSLVYIVVKDTLDNLIQGATVKILQKDFLTGSLDLIETLTTNFEGKAIAGLSLNDEIYQFIVEYPSGTVLLTTTESQIYGSTVTLIVDLIQTTGFEEIFRGYTLSGSVTYLNGSDAFRCVYNDESNTASEGCLRIYNLTSAQTLYIENCTSSPAGTITSPFTLENGTVYKAVCVIVDNDGAEYFMDQYILFVGETLPETVDSLLMIVLMIILFVFAIGYSPEMAIMAASAVPLMFTAMQLTQLSYFVTVPVLAGGVIVAFIIGVIRR